MAENHKKEEGKEKKVATKKKTVKGILIPLADLAGNVCGRCFFTGRTYLSDRDAVYLY